MVPNVINYFFCSNIEHKSQNHAYTLQFIHFFHEKHVIFCINILFVFFLTLLFKGRRFINNRTIDLNAYIKPTNTVQYLEHSSAYNASVVKGFIKGETIRNMRNASDPTILKEILSEFKTNLKQED